jgi:hypothetical protein
MNVKELITKNPVTAKVILLASTVMLYIQTASAALDTNVTDGITFTQELGAIAIGYFLAPPLVYFVVIIAALIILLTVGRLFKRFM